MKTVTEILTEARVMVENEHERYICYAIENVEGDSDLKEKLGDKVTALIDGNATMFCFLTGLVNSKAPKPEWLDDENLGFDPGTVSNSNPIFTKARLNLIDHMLKLEAEGKLLEEECNENRD